MEFEGYRLHHEKNLALCPGRGVGVGDVPNLKIIGDVDPSDIAQGSVGDCWLLSGISSLAEFDGAVKRLFRKTPDLESMPRDTPNMYTITLWDLPTWSEVVRNMLCYVCGCMEALVCHLTARIGTEICWARVLVGCCRGRAAGGQG